jgi:hypothetical protein
MQEVSRRIILYRSLRGVRLEGNMKGSTTASNGRRLEGTVLSGCIVGAHGEGLLKGYHGGGTMKEILYGISCRRAHMWRPLEELP